MPVHASLWRALDTICTANTLHGCPSISPSPGHLREDASLDPHEGAGIPSKFLARRSQEVLPYDRKIETFSKMPPQPEISRAIGPDGLRRKCARVSIGLVELEMFWQVEERLEAHEMARTRSLVGIEQHPCISESRLVLQPHMKERIGATLRTR